MLSLFSYGKTIGYGLDMAYKHTNSKGVGYYLNSKVVRLRSGREQKIYYFSKDTRPEGVDELPAGFVVVENPRTCLPTLKTM